MDLLKRAGLACLLPSLLAGCAGHAVVGVGVPEPVYYGTWVETPEPVFGYWGGWHGHEPEERVYGNRGRTSRGNPGAIRRAAPAPRASAGPRR